MESLILNFFLLILQILLNFGPDASHKQNEFSKTLSEKGFKFVLSKRDRIVASNLSFVLLPAKIDPVLKKRGHKGDTFVTCGSGHIKIIFTLLTEVVILYIQAFIV